MKYSNSKLYSIIYREDEEPVQRDITDLDTIIEYRGLAEGENRGKVLGRALGRAEARIRTAFRLMCLTKLTVEDIARLTGLPVKEIKNMKTELKTENAPG